MPIDSSNPFIRQPWHRRVRTGARRALRQFGGVLVGVPRTFLRQVRSAPRPLRILLLLLTLGAVLGGGYFLWETWGERQDRHEITSAWLQFEAQVKTGKPVEELVATLDRILAVNPDDAQAQARRDALVRGHAARDDLPMAMLLLRVHLKNSDSSAAAREAETVLIHRPNDWLAHCSRAAHLLNLGERTAAVPHLDALAMPDLPGADPDPASLMQGIRLLRATGRNPQPIHEFIVAHVLPRLKSEQAVQASPVIQADLVALYAEAFHLVAESPTPLVESWAAASRLGTLCLQEARTQGNTYALALLADQGAKLAQGLSRLHQLNHIAADEEAILRLELEQRTRSAWEAVLAVDPQAASAYHGLALAAMRAGDLDEAARQIVAGLQASGDDARLFALFSVLMRRLDRTDDAMLAMINVAERNAKSATLWLLAAEAAVAANRRDVALMACQKARTVAPGQPAAVYMEARLWLDAGKSEEALTLLRAFPHKVLLGDPRTVRGYARALAETGDLAGLKAFLEQAETQSNTENSPAAVVAACNGVLDAPYAAERHAMIVQATGAILARWGTAPEALRLRAQALQKLHEYEPQSWTDGLSRDLLRSYELAVAFDPEDWQLVAGLVRARLLTDPDGRRAWQDAQVLLTNRSRLPDEANLALGEVYLARQEPGEAIPLLVRLAQSREPRPASLILLARAYLQQGRTSEALTTLRRAQTMPQTPRDRVGWQATMKSWEQARQ